MSNGIGASPLRQEDRRLTTGKGRYTDDFKVFGTHFAAFVRSPHAHAEITGINKAAAEAAPGVVAVYDGHQLTGDGIGNIICGWAITSKDGRMPPSRVRPGRSLWRSPTTGSPPTPWSLVRLWRNMMRLTTS